MIRPAGIINLLKQALAEDTAIESWAIGLYQRRQIVHVGFDRRNEPSESAMPMIVLRPLSGAGGQSANEIQAGILLSILIHDAANTDAGYSGTRTPVCRYVAAMAALEDLIWTCVKTAINAAGLAVDEVAIAYNDDAFPIIQSTWDITFRIMQPMGAAEPTL